MIFFIFKKIARWDWFERISRDRRFSCGFNAVDVDSCLRRPCKIILGRIRRGSDLPRDFLSGSCDPSRRYLCPSSCGHDASPFLSLRRERERDADSKYRFSLHFLALSFYPRRRRRGTRREMREKANRAHRECAGREMEQGNLEARRYTSQWSGRRRGPKIGEGDTSVLRSRRSRKYL